MALFDRSDTIIHVIYYTVSQKKNNPL